MLVRGRRLVEIGDRLTAVAGEEPLGELALERVRRLLRGPAGREVELAFERGGETVRVVLRLVAWCDRPRRSAPTALALALRLVTTGGDLLSALAGWYLRER